MEILRRTPWSRIQGQNSVCKEFLEIVGNGKPTGSAKITNPAVECRDGLARITFKELAITHPAKDGILLNACSTRTRMVAVLGKSALLHIVRLTHSRRNGPNRIKTKASWLY